MLANVAAKIAHCSGNILDVHHHRTILPVLAKGASLYVSTKTHSAERSAEIRGFAKTRISLRTA